ncbi:MAG: hypothetical protein JWM95_734 [Gemmatimonadetes bacterium]|nr:hypothetical protein [Gemmatimonadota bacterium]
MASTARIDELKKKFDENPRRYFAPLANEFRKSGDIDQAIIICEEFLPQQPGHMSGHIVYGQALYEAGKLPESRAVFETALGLDPENLIALRHLGDIAKLQNDLPTARSWYVRVLEADPRNDEIQSLIASLDSGAPAASNEEETEEETFAPPVVEASIDLSLVDTQPLGMPSVPPPLSEPATHDLLDGFSTSGFDAAPDDAQTHAPTEGLESTSFVPPAEPIPEFEDLDASLDSGVPSFSAPETPVQALSGLQGSGGMDVVEPLPQHILDASFTPGFPAVELDDAMVLPPHGDPVVPVAEMAARAPVAELPDEPELLDFEMPVMESLPIEPDAGASESASPEHADVEFVAPALAELDSFEPVADAPAPDVDASAFEAPVVSDMAASRPPFVTETMAELYLAQGFREQALSVYVQLSSANPSDERLQQLVSALSAAPAADARATVRDFLARIAARRPGEAAVAAAPPQFDDFAAEPAQDAAEPQPAPTAVAETAPAEPVRKEESSTAAEGSINALFGNRPPGTAEDSAAAALAQAFGSSAQEVPSMAGRPAHAAAEELSLDSVFRDSPARQPRTSQSFSFDQFFSGGSAAATGTSRPSGAMKRTSTELPMPGDPPAERSADDIEQFNNWLQGLKQR